MLQQQETYIHTQEEFTESEGLSCHVLWRMTGYCTIGRGAGETGHVYTLRKGLQRVGASVVSGAVADDKVLYYRQRVLQQQDTHNTHTHKQHELIINEERSTWLLSCQVL